MPTTSFRAWLTGLATLLAVGLVLGFTQLPAIGAGGLLHPGRRQVTTAPPPGCLETTFDGAGITLRGWRCAAVGSRRGTLIYLHGIADNRTGSAGLIDRFTRRGFDVIAYDSRAHGQSDGDACTYGFFEKQDLHRVIDTLAPGPVVLVGQSLGAAVGLQEAADDTRVSAIVAAETFSSLRDVVHDRAPFVFTSGTIDKAYAIAERQAGFNVDAVSPVNAAIRITAPVLLIHGSADIDTPPSHSRRVYAALNGPKRLRIVAGARHNESMHAPDVWRDIEDWLEQAVAR